MTSLSSAWPHLHINISALVLLRRHIKGLMQKAGLSVREDVMGNIFGRWEGSQPGAGNAGIFECCPGTFLSRSFRAKPRRLGATNANCASQHAAFKRHLVTMVVRCSRGAVASGSHSDSIVQGGAYDGALGIVGALAAVQVGQSGNQLWQRYTPARPANQPCCACSRFIERHLLVGSGGITAGITYPVLSCSSCCAAGAARRGV